MMYFSKLQIILKNTPSWLLLSIGILSACLTVVQGNSYISILGVILTSLVLLAQYYQAKKYIHVIDSNSWIKLPNGFYSLVIPEMRHIKGTNINVSVYEKMQNGMMVKVECDESISEDGDIVITSSEAIEGEIRLY